MTNHLWQLRRVAFLFLAAAAGTAQAATFDLWAQPGTVSLPGATGAITVAVWGYATSAASAAAVPGPALIVTQGEVVTVTLHNGLAEPSALHFPGQPLVPDLSGAAPGGAASYTFTAGAPGTYLYEAGLLPGKAHQAPMGLYGALVVRPPATTPPQAYPSPATAYDDEAVLVLSELDPALNAAPTTFDLRNFAPRYFLINGQPWPGTAPIPTVAGHRVLLRYLNAGVQHHSMALLGLSQTVVATDGSPRTFGQAVVAETLPPGTTLDAIATIPAGALAGSRFALYDASLKLQNGTGSGLLGGFGGMLTFLVSSPAGGGTAPGPTTTGVALAPNPTSGAVAVAVTATVAVAPGSTGTVTGAELFVDAPGAAGTGTPMTGAFGAATVAVTGSIPAAVAAALATGPHTVYVRGLDSAPAWGAFATATLTVDQSGPTTGPVALSPNPASGGASVAVAATLGLAGGSIAGAEYFLDATGAGGTGTPMTGAFGGVTVAATGAITTGRLASLASGLHTVYVHGRSAGGNWGAFNFAILNLDRLGPAITGPVLTPNPVGLGAVAVHATGNDSATGGSNVMAADYRIDGGAATALAVNAASPIASLDAVIPATTVAALAGGTHTVAIQAQDALGNLGAVGSITLTVDRTGPATTGVAAAPSPNDGTVPLRVTASIADAVSGVVAAEGFVDLATGATPTPGTGFVLAAADGAFGGATEAVAADVPVATLAALAIRGGHTIAVRGLDSAGNWGGLARATFARSGRAVADTLALNANTNTGVQTQNVSAAAGLLANDLPGGAGRTATLASGPIRIGTGTGTIAIACQTTGVIGTVCANGSYQVRLTPTGATGAARQASKRGTYTFTYRMVLNGVPSPPANVTVTVN